jgi:hypothetical protein
MKINGGKIPVIDLYHFSARKSDRDDFYGPVIAICFPAGDRGRTALGV